MDQLPLLAAHALPTSGISNTGAIFSYNEMKNASGSSGFTEYCITNLQ